MIFTRRLLITASLALTTAVVPIRLMAQSSSLDKAEADRLVYELLSTNTGVRNWHKDIDFANASLGNTREQNIKVLKGKSFQVSTLRSDIYVDNTTRTPVFGQRYPMESAINLLMNAIETNDHLLAITHHQYGKVKKKFTIPMQTIYDVLALEMDLYCSITKLDTTSIEANLVMRQSKRNFIHMFVVRIPMGELFKKEGILQADLYTNIPQNDIKQIYTKKEK